ncbi:hypothetical protein BDQ17DRAFT_1478726 [Cyathus striatus]|nr:hypothetical protein BDQ17DRAFT_1478726 [Cyathus striatus]
MLRLKLQDCSQRALLCDALKHQKHQTDHHIQLPYWVEPGVCLNVLSKQRTITMHERPDHPSYGLWVWRRAKRSTGRIVRSECPSRAPVTKAFPALAVTMGEGKRGEKLAESTPAEGQDERLVDVDPGQLRKDDINDEGVAESAEGRSAIRAR